MSRKYFRRIWYSKFVRSVAIVASGTAGAQAVALAFAPIITRLYGPEAFGVMGTFVGLVGVLSTLAAMAYPLAIVLPKNDADALGLARLSVAISGGTAALLVLVLLLFKDSIVRSFALESIASFLFLLPLAMVLSSAMAIMTQWVIRKMLFRVRATTSVMHALMVNGVKTIVGFVHPLAWVLVGISLAGTALYAYLLLIGVRHHPRGHPARSVDQPSSAKELAIKYRDFPLYRAPQNALNAVSHSLPILALAAFFGPASAGFYTLGQTVLGAPIRLVGTSVADVFYPKANEIVLAGGDITELIVKGTGVLSLIGLVPFISVGLFGPWLFSLIFGTEWSQAGQYAQWLSLMLFFNFINKPAVAAIPVLGLQKGLIIYELFSTSTKIAALYLGFTVFADDIAAVALFSISGAITYIALILWVVVKSRGKSIRDSHAKNTS